MQDQLLELNRKMQEAGQNGDHPQVERYMDDLLAMMKIAGFPPAQIEERAHLRIRYSMSVKRLVSAREAADAWLMGHPDDPTVLDLLGSISLELDRKLEALDAFKTLYALDPTKPYNQYKFLHLLNLLDYREEANLLCDRLLKADVDEPRLFKELIQALLKFGRTDEALQSIDRYQVLRPDDAFVHYARGQALHDTGRYEQALESLRKIPERDSQWGDAALLAGLCLTKLRKFDESCDLYVKILTRFPQDTQTMLLLEQTLARLKKREGMEEVREIRQWVSKILLSDEEAAYLWRSGDTVEHARLRSITFRNTGQYRQAENLLLEACEIEPDSHRALENLAEFYLSTLQASKAEALYRQLIPVVLAERKETYRIRLAGALLRQDRAEEVLEMYEKAEPRSNLYLTLLGLLGSYSLEIKGDPGKALSYLKKLDEPSPQVEALIAQAHYQLGQYGQAIRQIEALPGEARNPSVQLVYAQALAKSGKIEPAHAIFGKTIEQHPELPILMIRLAQAVVQSSTESMNLSSGDESDIQKQIQCIREKVVTAHRTGWPQSIPLLLEISEMYEELGDKDSALRYARMAFEADPKRTDLRERVIQQMNQPKHVFERLHQIYLATIDGQDDRYEQQRLQSLSYLQLVEKDE